MIIFDINNGCNIPWRFIPSLNSRAHKRTITNTKLQYILWRYIFEFTNKQVRKNICRIKLSELLIHSLKLYIKQMPIGDSITTFIFFIGMIIKQPNTRIGYDKQSSAYTRWLSANWRY